MNTLVSPTIAEQVAKALLQINAISINVNKPFRYVSGMLAPLYTDNRLLISHPKEWKIVIRQYENVIKNTIGLESIDLLSGTATAAIPHAAVLASNLHIPMIYVRSSKKDHGKENLIEGEIKAKSRVLIIEDLISTGSSVTQNVNAIREAQGKVKTCLAITTSTVHAYENTMNDLKIKLYTLTNIQTVIEVAKQLKQINTNEYKTIQAFLLDPPNWGKKFGFV
jgi:orotate phosphoribosyltransferase